MKKKRINNLQLFKTLGIIRNYSEDNAFNIKVQLFSLLIYSIERADHVNSTKSSIFSLVLVTGKPPLLQ